jgi:hypothetical protein
VVRRGEKNAKTEEVGNILSPESGGAARRLMRSPPQLFSRITWII